MSTVPETAQAIRIEKNGGVEVLEKKTIPLKVSPGEVVIKVDYLGVNFIDTYHRAGLYKVPLPTSLGKEAAGTIIGLPTDDETLSNEVYKKRGYKIGGKVAVDFFGAHADHISIPWKTVYPVPEAIDTRIAAAALLQALTVVSFIDEAYSVQKGDTILVHTIAGGLGLIFAQLISARGATVIGTTSTPEKAELAKKNGAHHVILYKSENVVERVLEITNGEGVNAIFDGVGKDTFDNNFKMIRRKGTIVSVGNASGAVPPFSPLKLIEKNVKLLRPTQANYTYTPEEVDHYNEILWPLISDGTLKINIFKEYPFTVKGYTQAQEDLVGGRTTGKVIVDISKTD
ncbi:hypothetical protein BDV98DRAFT_591337 [Pterulicium gracile]|uniref:Probable quinone oxidoreductase n=1 Tax=Pterulicium gracile TaxID=1884261 RepID=A0A5C3QYN2_9AGAR|nr:hypothetical protein BDV98DRAFT_591337 [Pterula gracilis]